MKAKAIEVAKAIEFCKKSRQYVTYSVAYGVVKKIFNNGNGALSLYKFGKTNKVTANTLLETKSDRRKLMEFIPDCIVIEQKLGYPEWYSKSLINPDNT